MSVPQPHQRIDPAHRANYETKRQALILQHVHDAVIATDLDGIIESWNPAAERIYGWSAGEVIGQHIQLLYFDDDGDRYARQVLAAGQAEDVHEVTVRKRHKSDREVLVALRLSLLRDESGQAIGVIGCSNDITELKQGEQALQVAKRRGEESQSLLTSLFSTASAGLGFLDSELRYVRVNEALAELNGVPVADHLGRRVRDVIPDLADTLEPLLYQTVIAERTRLVNLEVQGETPARPGELRHWLANYYPVEGEDGSVLGVGAVVFEVTEQKRVEEAVRRERDFAEGLIQTAQAIVLVLDPQGRIVRFNPFMECISGYRLEEVQGKDWFRTFLPERNWRDIRQVFRRAVRNIDVRGNVNPIVTKEGIEREISWWSRTLTDADGHALGVLYIGHDITELLEAQERALRAERLAAIGQTVTAVAHETRNELLGLGMGLGMLAESVAGEAKSAELVALLRESQSRLQHLFDDLRGFAAPIKLERTSQTICEIWRRAWSSLERRRAGRTAVLSEQISCPACAGLIDALRIEQVFRNLFENALAACRDPVQIEAHCAEQNIDGKQRIRIIVRDNGPGLTAEQRQKLFEPFFTTKPQGTGLGLPIAKRIIEAHGGTIEVGETPQRGAEFVLTLPSLSIG
jgi:PAS domain S-box-containing protein